jgi:hypothetical protein
MDLGELLKEHFQYMPGVYAQAVAGNCMIWWYDITSYFDGGEGKLNMARDSLVIRLVDGVVTIKRVDCGDRILGDEPWKTMDPHDPKLISEIHKMIMSL